MAIDSRTYTLPYIKRREAWRSAYPVIADAFARAFGTGSIIDIGCAGGLLVEALRERGFDAWGLDGASASESLWPEGMRDRYLLADLSEPDGVTIPATDLVCSLEVAEHLPRAAAPGYVALLVRHQPGRVLFTAAPPGQAGIGHVNCQSFSYWVALFAAHGYELDVHGLCFVRHALRSTVDNAGRQIVPRQYVSNFMTFAPRNAPRSLRVDNAIGLALVRSELAAQRDLLNHYAQKTATINDIITLLRQSLGEPTEGTESEMRRLQSFA